MYLKVMKMFVESLERGGGELAARREVHFYFMLLE